MKIFTKIGVKKDWLGDKQDKRDGTALVAVDVTVNNTTGAVSRRISACASRPGRSRATVTIALGPSSSSRVAPRTRSC